MTTRPSQPRDPAYWRDLITELEKVYTARTLFELKREPTEKPHADQHPPRVAD
jgi:hypothetical protein